MEEELVMTSVTLPKGLYERVRIYAEKDLDGRPMTYVIRKAVQQYMDSQREQPADDKPTKKAK